MNLWLNIAAFQVGWFACVLGAAHGAPWVGAAVAGGVIGLHLMRAPQPRYELMLILFAAALGLVVDTTLMNGRWLAFDSGFVVAGAAPYWMVALWMIFATTLNVSLAWLKNRRWLASGLGALGGPLAYYSGAKLGAVTLVDTPAALIAIGAAWALATPLLLLAAHRLNGTLMPRAISEASRA